MLKSTDEDFTPSDIFQAYYDCRKTKRNTWNALVFEERLERNLMDLYYELKEGSYMPGRSICFVIEHPKLREIWAADFRDRIVHHLLYNKVSDRFHNSFINDSYACIPEKGTHRAVDKAEKMVRSITQDYKYPAFYLKADISNFFVSIQKDILETLILEKIPEPWWADLTKVILHHDPTKDVHVKGSRWLLKQMPPHKSLFNAKGHGLPIGNLSSQFFANVYLNKLDQYAKHTLKIKRYVRYVDDILILSREGAALNTYVPQIDQFIKDHLKLHLHPNKIEINRVDSGFKMLGFVCRPRVRYLRNETVKRAKRKLNGMCRAKVDNTRIRATANSYFGICMQAKTYNVRKDIAGTIYKHGWLFDKKLTKTYPPKVCS